MAEPLADIFNSSLRKAEYPERYKFEICTPVPKVYPLKKMTSYDQQKHEEQIVDEISHLSDKKQAEIIAEKFASI